MKKIQLGGRKMSEIKGYALVDDKDYKWLNQWNWYLLSSGYAVRGVGENNKVILMHREIMKPSKEMDIDHINSNPLDNRRENLRICTHSQNLMNSKLREDNKSGVCGVSWYKRDKKWETYITVDQKRTRLGFFKNKREAIKVRKAAEKKYFGEFAYC